MTMLDRMRRHKNWLKWSLAIVVVAFVLLYIPSFLQPTAPPAPAPQRRRRRGRRPRDHRRRSSSGAYQQQMQAYRQPTAATSTTSC